MENHHGVCKEAAEAKQLSEVSKHANLILPFIVEGPASDVVEDIVTGLVLVFRHCPGKLQLAVCLPTANTQ